MTLVVEADQPLEAWKLGCRALLSSPSHRLMPLVVEISRPLAFSADQFRRVDDAMGLGNRETERVARTIMPAGILSTLDLHKATARVLRVAGPRSYFRRMADFDGSGRMNQIERTITGLRRAYVDPGPILLERASGAAAHRGFPCLSAIQFHRDAGLVVALATYRSQYYRAKAFGNFVGLGRLLQLVARESDLEPGKLVVVSTDARLERVGGMNEALNRV